MYVPFVFIRMTINIYFLAKETIKDFVINPSVVLVLDDYYWWVVNTRTEAYVSA